MNVPFNNKITMLSYENSGLNSPLDAIYNFQSTIVPRVRMNKGQPFIIANINNPTEHLRVGILTDTNTNTLKFRLSTPSQDFVTPGTIDNSQNYLFFDYNKVIQMSLVSYFDKPLSEFTYLFGDTPKLYTDRGLYRLPLTQLNEDMEYIVVSKETSQMYRGKFSHMVNTSTTNGGLFEFKIDKLPFIVKIVVNDTTCNFYLDNPSSLNRLSKTSLLNHDTTKLNVDNSRYINKQRTIRWIKSSSRNRSTTTKQENCITILLIAHGSVDKNLKIDENLMKNVNISLMGGGAGIYGIGGIFKGSHIVVDNIDDTSKKYTIPGDRSRSAMSIDMISRIYPDLLDKYYPIQKRCSDQFISIFEDIVDYLKTLYNVFGITFPKQGEYGVNDRGISMSLVKQRRNPFSIFTSFNEKVLKFYPRKEDIGDLSFGITILQSSKWNDFDYTLAGMSLKGGNPKNANLTEWSQNKVRNYWAQRILTNTASLDETWRRYYMEIYKTLSTPLNPNGKYEKRDVTMSQIIELFKDGMGFTNVNIIDYSCNSCVTPLTTLERGLIDVVGSHPTMKLHREIKNYVRSEMKNPEQVIRDIANPTTQQIVEIVGEKAKSTSYKKNNTQGSSIKSTMRAKSFGGKNKNKGKNKNSRRRKMKKN
jgi:hypothetical protein